MTETAAANTDQTEALVYACSGASNLGQLTNEIAVRLDRDGLAEMSCAEAVGIEAEPPYAAALSGRLVVAVSGCPLACANRLLAEHGVAVTRSIQLENRGVLKAKHVSVGWEESERIYEEVVSELSSVLATTPELKVN
ncbi:MAG: putative zinc-binding protein [Gaiellaceae bacterium]